MPLRGEAGTLQLPARLTFFQGWTPEPDPAAGASYTISDYELRVARPDPAIYQAPANAVLNDGQ